MVSGGQRSHRNGRNLVLIGILAGRSAQLVISLLMLRAATSLLSPEEMGKVALIVATVAFYSMFLINPIGTFINRRLHAWSNSGFANTYLLYYCIYIIIVASIAASSLPLIINVSGIDFGVNKNLLIFVICISLAANTANQTVIPSLNLLGHSFLFLVLSILTLVVGFAVALTFVELYGPLAHHWLLGLISGQAALATVGAILLVKKNKRNASSKQKKPGRTHFVVLYGFAWPVAISAGLGWVQSQGYRYVVGNWVGLDQLGLFVAGFTVSVGIISGVESVLTAYLQPRLFRDANSVSGAKRHEAWSLYASTIVPPLLVTAALVVGLAPELTRLLLGERFYPAASFVVWGALVETSRALFGVYTLAAHVRMNTRALIVPSAIGATLSLVLCISMVPSWGLFGAGAALTLSGVAGLTVMQLSLIRQSGPTLSSKAVWRALLMATMLVTAGYAIRGVVGSESLAQQMATVGLTGAIFAVLQFLLLRHHLVIRAVDGTKR